MNQKTKDRIQAILNPYRPQKTKVLAVYNDRLHFVTGFSFNVNSHKMNLRLLPTGPDAEQSFTILENDSFLGPIIFNEK